jgi:hypothetical protein
MRGLPKPNVTKAIILTVDMDTQSLVIKTAEQERPLVLHWNEETQFLKGRRQIVAASLKRRDDRRDSLQADIIQKSVAETSYRPAACPNPVRKWSVE